MALPEYLITKWRWVKHIVITAGVLFYTLKHVGDRHRTDMGIRVFLGKNGFQYQHILFDFKRRLIKAKKTGNPGEDQSLCNRIVDLMVSHLLGDLSNASAPIAKPLCHRPRSKSGEGIPNNENVVVG